LTLPFVVDKLSILLVSLDTLSDLFDLLLQAPNVLNSRLFALPRLNVEDRPEGDEKYVSVVDRSIDTSQIRDQERFAIFAILGTQR